jgi:hypothetical protein
LCNLPFAIGAAGAGAVGSVVGAGKQANATKQAAQTQANAANHATDIQANEFNTVQANEAPYQALGAWGVGQLEDESSVWSKPFDPTAAGVPAQFSYNPADVANDPAFQFAMQQGQQAIQRSAAAKGGLLGGAAVKSLDQFATGTAAQYENQDYAQAANTYNTNYSNAFNTFKSNQDSLFNKLSSITGMGQTAVSGVNGAGANAANNSSEIALGAGNSAAAGIIGSANAGAAGAGGVSSSISSLLNSPSFQSLLQQHSQANANASSYAKNTGYDYTSES